MDRLLVRIRETNSWLLSMESGEELKRLLMMIFHTEFQRETTPRLSQSLTTLIWRTESITDAQLELVRTNLQEPVDLLRPLMPLNLLRDTMETLTSSKKAKELDSDSQLEKILTLETLMSTERFQSVTSQTLPRESLKSASNNKQPMD
jgi:hypothetical protein